MPKPRLQIIVVVAISALGPGVGCTDDPRGAVDEEWRRMMQCSAYFSLRAAGERQSRTAAARRTADAAQADAAITFNYSHELGRLSGRTLVDTDSGLREIDADLRHAIDGDVSNVGRLRQRYEERCGSIVAEGQTRIEYWRNELDD